MKRVAVTGGFDDLRADDLRFLEEAARFGQVSVLLWSDRAMKDLRGPAPRCSEAERRYVLSAVRYVSEVIAAGGRIDPDALPAVDGPAPEVWVVDEGSDTPSKQEWCRSRGMEYRVLERDSLRRLPEPGRGLRDPLPAGRGARDSDSGGASSPPRKVVVTGCYDWFHSGHVRFFEEVSELGDLYVGVGSDENIRLLKGTGHPMFPARERVYIVQSIRFVKQAFIPTGTGWLDAEPQLIELEPDYYAVNEDGDKPEKRRFCEEHGIGYVVLKRLPKEGLAPRQSRELRGF